MLDRIYHDFIEEGKLMPEIDFKEKKEENK